MKMTCPEGSAAFNYHYILKNDTRPPRPRPPVEHHPDRAISAG